MFKTSLEVSKDILIVFIIKFLLLKKSLTKIKIISFNIYLNYILSKFFDYQIVFVLLKK